MYLFIFFTEVKIQTELFLILKIVSVRTNFAFISPMEHIERKEKEWKKERKRNKERRKERKKEEKKDRPKKETIGVTCC